MLNVTGAVPLGLGVAAISGPTVVGVVRDVEGGVAAERFGDMLDGLAQGAVDTPPTDAQKPKVPLVKTGGSNELCAVGQAEPRSASLATPTLLFREGPAVAAPAAGVVKGKSVVAQGDEQATAVVPAPGPAAIDTSAVLALLGVPPTPTPAPAPRSNGDVVTSGDAATTDVPVPGATMPRADGSAIAPGSITSRADGPAIAAGAAMSRADGSAFAPGSTTSRADGSAIAAGATMSSADGSANGAGAPTSSADGSAVAPGSTLPRADGPAIAPGSTISRTGGSATAQEAPASLGIKVGTPAATPARQFKGSGTEGAPGKLTRAAEPKGVAANPTATLGVATAEAVAANDPVVASLLTDAATPQLNAATADASSSVRPEVKSAGRNDDSLAKPKASAGAPGVMEAFAAASDSNTRVSPLGTTTTDARQRGDRGAGNRPVALPAVSGAAAGFDSTVRQMTDTSAFERTLGTRAAATVQAATVVGTALGESDIPHQIVQAIRMQWNQGIGTAHVTLQPDYLGSLSIDIRVERGAVTAILDASNPSVRQWIEGHEPALREALADQGLRLDRLVVQDEQPPSMSKDAQEGGSQQEQPKRRRPRQAVPEQTFEVVM